MDNAVYTIRLFTSDEVEMYKAIRLEALQTEPGMFGNSYAFEVSLSDEEWIDRVENPNYGRFGLFFGNEMIGLTAVIIDKNKPDYGYMTQSYIRKNYRRLGLSRLLYEARISWAKEHGLKYLEIGHKESNFASKLANQKFGFKFTRRENMKWPDGTVEDMLYYELEL